MKAFKENVISRLSSYIDIEKEHMKERERRRKEKGTIQNCMPRDVFDAIQHEHKENIRALKFAINNIKRNKKWEELTPEEKSKACTVNSVRSNENNMVINPDILIKDCHHNEDGDLEIDDFEFRSISIEKK